MLSCLIFQSVKTMNLSHSYAGFTKKSFGTPSYPSPLDRIRTGKGNRAEQLGLTPVSGLFYLVITMLKLYTILAVGITFLWQA